MVSGQCSVVSGQFQCEAVADAVAEEVEREGVECEGGEGGADDGQLGQPGQREAYDDGEQQQCGQDVGYPHGEQAAPLADVHVDGLAFGVALPVGGGDVEGFVFGVGEAAFAVGLAGGAGADGVYLHADGALFDGGHASFVGGYMLHVLGLQVKGYRL